MGIAEKVGQLLGMGEGLVVVVVVGSLVVPFFSVEGVVSTSAKLVRPLMLWPPKRKSKIVVQFFKEGLLVVQFFPSNVLAAAKN